jgi:molybdopterin-binding protein
MPRKVKSASPPESMLQLRDAALQLGISFPTIKQWIYKNKLRSVRTAGGHHRIPQSEVDKLLFRTRGRSEHERQDVIRRVSGRNQLVGRIVSVRISGLMAEVKISIGGQQITSIITATSAREMQLKKGQTAAALIKATEVMIIRV